MKLLSLDEEIVEAKLTELRTLLLSGTKSIDGKLSFDLGLGKAKDADRPQILILPDAYAKMRGLVQECAKEIGWHGTVIREGLKFTITDIVVFPQVVTAATVTPDDVAYTEWALNLPDDTFNSMRFHGHSHVRMACSPSAVDIAYQESLVQNVKDFYIVGIFNKNDVFNITLFDVTNNIAYDNTDIDFIIPAKAGEEWAKEMIAAYIEEPVAATAASLATTGSAATAASNYAYSRNQEDDYYEQLYGKGEYNGYGNWQRGSAANGQQSFFENSQAQGNKNKPGRKKGSGAKRTLTDLEWIEKQPGWQKLKVDRVRKMYNCTYEEAVHFVRNGGSDI